jgi:RNA polymerase sigma-70 factor (ECF subfamily)
LTAAVVRELAISTLDVEERRRRLHVLYDAHVRDVYSYIHRRCGDRGIAQDVTQDVFVTIARTIADPSDVTVAWLLRRARFRMIDIIRRRENYETKLMLIGDERTSRDEAVTVGERLRVEAALAQLSALHRTVLILRYVDDVTIEELTEQLGRSTKGVEALVTRARAALKTALEAVDG